MTKRRAQLKAAQPAPVAAQQQPAVWMQSDHLNKFIHQHCGSDSMLARCSHRQLMTDYQPLYTAPVAAPQREWVGLTEDDIFDEWGNCQPIDHGFPERYAKALDAALKEKNA